MQRTNSDREHLIQSINKTHNLERQQPPPQKQQPALEGAAGKEEGAGYASPQPKPLLHSDVGSVRGEASPNRHFQTYLHRNSPPRAQPLDRFDIMLSVLGSSRSTSFKPAEPRAFSDSPIKGHGYRTASELCTAREGAGSGDGDVADPVSRRLYQNGIEGEGHEVTGGGEGVAAAAVPRTGPSHNGRFTFGQRSKEENADTDAGGARQRGGEQSRSSLVSQRRSSLVGSPRSPVGTWSEDGQWSPPLNRRASVGTRGSYVWPNQNPDTCLSDYSSSADGDELSDGVVAP